MHKDSSNKTKQLSGLEQVWTVEQMLEKRLCNLFSTEGWFQYHFCFGCIFFYCMNSCLLGSESLQNMFTPRWQVIHSSPSELSEGMLHSTVLQWPCNAILYAGPSGQILLASISCWRDQRSTFSLGLLWKTWEWSGDDSVFIAEGHLHTRLFPVPHCPSQVDLTGQHRPLTSWIMHCGHTHTVSYLVAGCLCCGRLRLFVLRSSTEM